MWLNAFPATNGVSQTLSPRTIVTGLTLDFRAHCRIEPGSYVQTHEEHNNSMLTRTVGAIALLPSGNSQGGHYFLSLNTGRRIHRQHWTELPMPAEVINRVHSLGRNSPKGLTFGWRDATEIYDDIDADDNVTVDDLQGVYRFQILIEESLVGFLQVLIIILGNRIKKNNNSEGSKKKHSSLVSYKTKAQK